MAQSLDENNEDSDLFGTAMKTFRASLSPEDQSQFQSYSTAALMIADLQLFIQDAQQPNIGKDFLSKMSSISESWQPYFDILSILVSAHPEYCAFFWGAIKFVFLVGRHYITFFEKILNLFGEMSRSFHVKTEYLKQIEEWQKESGNRKVAGLLTILGAIYSDTISFCQQVHQIFGLGRKDLRKKGRILNYVLWVPFNKR
ncbi:hypothetical protein MMC28_010844, partial [Mycoblastus sanguinarius]|nr:hypothetical protein [Mycoblastus sanguinarius]